MYQQIEKPKEYKSRAGASSVAQMKDIKKRGFAFEDNRLEAVAQKTMRTLANSNFSHPIQKKKNKTGFMNDSAGVIQRVTTITITNTTDNYDSGWVRAETRSTGVNAGPQREAQAVAAIAGGDWVGGHMVNDRLGGTGGFENIVPITASMNNQHHTIENAAQRIVGDGTGPHEVRYRMNILSRKNYTITPKNDVINNLADSFQQSYDYRTKEVQAGGTSSRPIPYQAPGPITTVVGDVLNMSV